MTAERSIRDRAAEVLREHLFRTGGSQDAYLGVCSCEIADHRGAPYSHDDWRAHLADALAAAGLLAEDRAPEPPEVIPNHKRPIRAWPTDTGVVGCPWVVARDGEWLEGNYDTEATAVRAAELPDDVFERIFPALGLTTTADIAAVTGIDYPPGEIVDINWVTMSPTYKPNPSP